MANLEAKLKVRAPRAFNHGDVVIGPFEQTANFNSSGVASLQVIETATCGEKLLFMIEIKEGLSKRTILFDPAIVPDEAALDLTAIANVKQEVV